MTWSYALPKRIALRSSASHSMRNPESMEASMNRFACLEERRLECGEMVIGTMPVGRGSRRELQGVPVNVREAAVDERQHVLRGCAVEELGRSLACDVDR